MRTVTTGVASCVLAVFASASISGQTAGKTGANPMTQGLKTTWDGVKQNIKESADLMPEAGYSFKPAADVRSFGQIVAHLAGANYVFCAAAKGEKPPHAEDEFEKTATTKAAIVKAIGDSIAYCDAVHNSLTDASAGQSIAMPFNMGSSARATALMMNVGHNQEHYGNLVTYFRMKGMVPPSTARQQRTSS